MSDDNDLKLQVAILRTKFEAFEAKAKEDSEFFDKKIDDNHDELTLKIRHDKGNTNQKLSQIQLLSEKRDEALDQKLTTRTSEVELRLDKRLDDLELRLEKRFTLVENSVEKKLSTSDFLPIKNIVYGLVAIILTVFATAVAKFFIIPDVPPKA